MNSRTGNAAISYDDLLSNPFLFGLYTEHDQEAGAAWAERRKSSLDRLVDVCLRLLERVGLCASPRIISAGCIRAGEFIADEAEAACPAFTEAHGGYQA